MALVVTRLLAGRGPVARFLMLFSQQCVGSIGRTCVELGAQYRHVGTALSGCGLGALVGAMCFLLIIGLFRGGTLQ